MIPFLVLLASIASGPVTSLPVESPQQPASPWANAQNLEILSDERESLAGLKQMAVTVEVSGDLEAHLPRATLQSTVVFKLEQAGFVVLSKRDVVDPVLSLNVRTVPERDDRGRDTGRVVYRVSGDVLQVVRLMDHADKARIALASTWHAGNFGVAAGTNITELRTRVDEIVDAFVADHAAANSDDVPVRAPRLLPGR